MNTKTEHKKIIATNRKARFNYHIDEILEAGIVLSGSEVKSLRHGKINIAESYAGDIKGEIYLFNANIPEYDKANYFSHQAKRPRKLLLKKKQINKFLGQIKMKGMTLIILSVYFNQKNIAKVELALAKGKAEYDKREDKKDRDWNREKARIIRNQEQ